MKNSLKISKILVFNEDQRGRIFVGELHRSSEGYIFSYDSEYMSRASATPLGPDLPFSLQEIKSPKFFESLQDLIPSRANPAYEQYCYSVGVNPAERDPMVLLAYLGKGPSNFVFEAAPLDQLPTGQEVIAFREALGLSQKQFANLLDIPVPTLQTLEKETSEAKTSRRLIQILLETPSSLWKILKRRGVYLHSKQLRNVESYVRNQEKLIGERTFERQKKYRQLGYIEVFHSLVNPPRLWDQLELLEAAEKSECHNTGRPVGAVLHTDAYKPVFRNEGISVEVDADEFGYDNWSLKRDGAFHFFRLFEEEWDNDQKRNDILYFDTRIWRVAEIILHCAKLYKALDVNADEQIKLQITHAGLKNRKLRSSNPLRNSPFERKCIEDQALWEKAVLLKDLEQQPFNYVGEIVGELFMLFDDWKADAGIVKGIYEEFVKSRI